MSKNKKFSLIWWLETKEKDIVKTSIIPKKFRQINDIVKLTWKDFKTHKKTKADAKILAMSDNENELLKLIVSTNGTIHDLSQKIFSTDVVEENLEEKQYKKVTENLKKSSKKQIEEKIANGPHILSNINIRPNTHSSSPSFSHPSTSFDKNKKLYNLHNTARNTSSSLSSQSLSNHYQFQTLDESASNSFSRPLTPFYQNQTSYNLQDTASNIHSLSPSQSLPPSNSLSSTSSFLHPSTSFHQNQTFYNSQDTTHNTQTFNASKTNTHTIHLNQEPPPNIYEHQNSALSPIQSLSQNQNSKLNKSTTSSFSCSLTSSQQRIYKNNTDSSSPSSDSDSDSSSQNSRKSEQKNFGTGIFSGLPNGIITKRDIYFQEQLLKFMKNAYENQRKMDIESEEIFALPNHYFKMAEDKEEIAPNSGFFISKKKKTFLEMKAKLNKDWKIMVRETILDIYSASIANYSATGKRTNRPAIDPMLFKGLYEWINTQNFDVAKKDLINFINKMASNKRKYRNVKSKQKNKENKGQKIKKRKTEKKQQNSELNNINNDATMDSGSDSRIDQRNIIRVPTLQYNNDGTNDSSSSCMLYKL